MNSCDYYQELISRLIDGEISREEHEALMAHMNTCSRCNAMYAVFHDLSDILSEEPEPLPEGLHESIMAGVRRSEIIKKNRRLRTFGLRMALSAAACALLVLFAASGFGPGKHAEDVSLRTQEAAEQLYQAPQAPTAESMPAPTEDVFTLSAQTSAPTPVWPAAPAETFSVPTTPDAFLAAGNSVNETYNTLQPEQYIQYQLDQYAAPVTVQTPAPAQYYEPFTVAQTPAPAEAQMSAPTAVQAPAAVEMQTPAPAPAAVQAPAAVEMQMSAPVETQSSVELQGPASVPEQVTEPVVLEDVEAPILRTAAPAPAVSQDEALASEEIDVSETVVEVAPFTMSSSAPAVPEGETAVSEATEDVNLMLFSGNGIESVPDQPDEEKGETMDTENAVLLWTPAESAVPELKTEDLTPDAAVPMPEENGEKIEELPAAMPEKEAEEESVRISGKTGHDRLLALLGGSESELPAEAELTRVVHVTLVPDDVYGGEEKMDISIYGDFVYYSLYPAEGEAKSCRAACALRDLDSLLMELTAPGAAESDPSPTPTADPYAAEEPTA